MKILKIAFFAKDVPFTNQSNSKSMILCLFSIFISMFFSSRRLDYFVVSKRFMENIAHSFIRDNVMGSDHAPVVLLFST